MNEQQNNEIEELETLDEQQATVQPVEQVQPNPVTYEQQVNEVINSVTMADLVDPTIVEKKKKKKGLIVALVVIVLVLGVTSILFLNDGTFSKLLGKTTTSELDVFKTESTTSSEKKYDKEYGKFTQNGNQYILDISTAENGHTLKYLIKSNLVAYVKFADDYDTSKNYTFNLNNADYYIEDTNPGQLILTIESDYIAFMNTNNQENQVILSKKGIKIEEDPEVDPEVLKSTTTATTTTSTKSMVHKDFTFQSTTDAEGRTTIVLTEYDPEWTEIDYIWEDEDGVRHVVGIGSEESRQNHPELYTEPANP